MEAGTPWVGQAVAQVPVINHKSLNNKKEFGKACPLGRSEKPKSWKSKNGQADYLPRHSPDVRTVFEIWIRLFVSCEIALTRFTILQWEIGQK